MNIIFVSNGIYPDQHAAAIRHSTIAQGMVENGHFLNFLLLSVQTWQNPELNYKGVLFETLNSYYGNSKLLRIFNFYKALNKTKERILKINLESKIDAIVVFSIDIIVIQTLISFAKKHRIKIFHERTELPYVVGKENSIFGKVKFNFYLKTLIPEFDGIFVISDKLKSYLSKYNHNIEKILTVVDTKFFSSGSDRIYDFPYIAYCGTMSGTKDGVPILIESFTQLSKTFTSHKLILIGDNRDKQKIKETLDAIEQFEIQEKVVFTGLINRNDMPGLLGHADLLVVSKPENEQNSGNFPIKIGEYLATGVPVVVTKVGEISKFIIDGQTGFLSLPDSAESFYLKMDEALTDYEKAREIGIKGKQIAEKIFGYKIQAKRMCDYINKINKSNGS